MINFRHRHKSFENESIDGFSINQSTCKPINRTINPRTNEESIIQSFNQPVSQSLINSFANLCLQLQDQDSSGGSDRLKLKVLTSIGGGWPEITGYVPSLFLTPLLLSPEENRTVLHGPEDYFLASDLWVDIRSKRVISAIRCVMSFVFWISLFVDRKQIRANGAS